VLTGDDPRDAITAVAHSRQPVVYSNYTGRHSLVGKRLGVVRDFMIEATIADRENIRIGNEALADMKNLGATLVDPVDFSGAIRPTSRAPSMVRFAARPFGRQACRATDDIIDALAVRSYIEREIHNPHRALVAARSSSQRAIAA
jgi:hypothetical protein